MSEITSGMRATACDCWAPDFLAYPSSLPRLSSSIRCRSITAATVENLELITPEVSSNFGETHNYWLDASNQRTRAPAKRYTTSKVMHVSPFMYMGLQYD
jgi:hypothetical protein